MYRFTDCEVDLASRELRCAGALVHLEPQAFDLLVHLIEHRDRIVTKNDLLDGVWGHRFVSDANLTTRVNEVRRAVGDDGARQHIIKTVHGRGYRFVAAMDDVAAVVSSMGLIGRDELISAIAVRLRDSSLVTCGISLWRVRRIPRVGRGTSYGGVIRNALMIRRSSGSARSAGSDSPATSIVPPTRNNRSARDEADGGG